MKEKKKQIWEDNALLRQEEVCRHIKIFDDSNKVLVRGIIEQEFSYSHTIFRERFYITKIRVKRLSGVEDNIPIVVSETFKKKLKGKLKGKEVDVAGTFQSYNEIGEDGKFHVKLFIFVSAIDFYKNTNNLECDQNENIIYLKGIICKKPIFRLTRLQTEIAEILIAVNRRYEDADYIHCIAWNNFARYAENLEVGEVIELYGRVQSRRYFKRWPSEEHEGEYKETYEVSVIRMKREGEEWS